MIELSPIYFRIDISIPSLQRIKPKKGTLVTKITIGVMSALIFQPKIRRILVPTIIITIDEIPIVTEYIPKNEL